MSRISEAELVLPALYLLEESSRGMSTSELRVALEDLLKPSGEDLAILANRADTKFSQKVRNLKAHDTLLKKGLVTEDSEGGTTLFVITKEGRDFVQKHIQELGFLLDFPFDDIKVPLRQLEDNKPLIVIDERTVSEGELRVHTVEYRTRSRELRKAALEHYSENGRIPCHACTFDFASAYPGLGDRYIQFHHLKPISYMQGKELRMEEALSNICPLCANCHQMAHRERPPVQVRDLRAKLRVSYAYT